MMIAKKFGKNICSIKVHHSSHGLMEIGWEVFRSDRISSLEWKWILKYFHFTALRQWTVMWDEMTEHPPVFDKVQFWHWHPAAHSHFPSTRCLFKCVTKVSIVVDMWQCLRLLTVNPALPHCVAALAGHITTFKLHTTVDSYGSHGGIVCLYLWWKFCSGFSSALHHFIWRKVFTRVKVSPVCTSPCRHWLHLHQIQTLGTRQPPQCLGSSHS